MNIYNLQKQEIKKENNTNFYNLILTQKKKILIEPSPSPIPRPRYFPPAPPPPPQPQPLLPQPLIKFFKIIDYSKYFKNPSMPSYEYFKEYGHLNYKPSIEIPIKLHTQNIDFIEKRVNDFGRTLLNNANNKKIFEDFKSKEIFQLRILFFSLLQYLKLQKYTFSNYSDTKNYLLLFPYLTSYKDNFKYILERSINLGAKYFIQNGVDEFFTDYDDFVNQFENRLNNKYNNLNDFVLYSVCHIFVFYLLKDDIKTYYRDYNEIYDLIFN
jgi:hypothetical protein